MKTLYLVRHAKSSWKDESLTDMQRPLNKRGKRNAPEMGRRLVESGAEVDLILSSPAVRAISTAKILAGAINFDPHSIKPKQALYFNGVNAHIRLIRQTADDIDSLMLVGHNPDITSVLNMLCGFQTDNMPTCAIARIKLNKSWSDIVEGEGQLLDYDFPKKYGV